jgi:hypothetical protein
MLVGLAGAQSIQAWSCQTPDFYPACRIELAHRIWAEYRLAGVAEILPTQTARVIVPESECSRPEGVALAAQAHRIDDIRLALLEETRRAWASKFGQRYRADIERCQRRQFEIHQQASRAADSVYRLQAPEGYKIVRAESRGDFSDIQSRLLRPRDLTQPFIFSIAGT